MMIPLTPDVQSRIILCSRQQQNESEPEIGETKCSTHSAVTYVDGEQKPKSGAAPRSSANALELRTKQAGLKRSQSSYTLRAGAAAASNDVTSEKAVVHRSRSTCAISPLHSQQPDTAANDERARDAEAKAAARAALPSRVHWLRHVMGFRKYNRLPGMRKKIIEACEIIESMTQSQHGAYKLALDQVNESLLGLAAAEQCYYREVDRVNRYEQKVDELDYLKANIELCIKDSVTFMKTKYYTEYLPLVGSNRSQERERRWRDHREIRIFVNQLITNMESAQENEEQSHSIPSMSVIHQEIQEARAQCARLRGWPGLHLLFEAEDELVELQEHLDKIQRSETVLRASLLRYQASANTLLNVNREIKATTRILKARAELAAGEVDSETRDLDDEERLLREFVITARHFDTAASPSTPTPSTPTPSPRNYLPPMSSDTPPTPFTSPPVWATTWSPATKVLPRRSERRSSEYQGLHDLVLN